MSFLRHITTAFLSTAILLGCSCGNQGASKSEEKKSFSPLEFPIVEVPLAMQGSREAALEYVLLHYWDEFTRPSRSYPCDSTLVSGVRVAEVNQAFLNFARLMTYADIDLGRRAVALMCEKALSCEAANPSSNVFETLVELSEKLLYDPNSMFRNEDLYGVVAERLSRFEGFSEARRMVYEYDAQMCALNAVGTKAADFSFSDEKGRVRTLYEVKSQWILLFFSNPGCHSCKDIIEKLGACAEVEALIGQKKLTVLNIYIDEDLKSWYEYMPIYPKNWINAYDPNGVIRADVLYNVRAIPSLYLLDCDKRVVMKDVPEDRVIEFLRYNHNNQ